MELLIEWSPLIAFFAAYKFAGIYVATAILMVACAAPLFAHRWRAGRYKPMHVVTLAVAWILGAATLLLHDARFIQWKPTVLFGISAVVFLASHFVGRRPLVQRLLESLFEAPLAVSSRAWSRLNVAWSAWFALLAATNVYVARSYSEATWVNFKLFGLTAALFLFMLPQVAWLAGRAKVPAADAGAAP